MFAIGALFFHSIIIPIVAPLLPEQFGNESLFRPWAGWTWIYMALHPLWYGAVFATIYLVLLRRGRVVSGWKDGLLSGLGVFLVGSLPVYLLAYASFAVSREVIAAWVAQSACQYLAAGAAVGLVARRS